MSQRVIFSWFIIVCLTFSIIFTSNAAFAATQPIPATSDWRTYSAEEMAQLNPGSSVYEEIGNPSDPIANAQNADGSSPGWTPSGVTDARPTGSKYSSIILDLPRVDLQCSSDVSISITSGTVELLSDDDYSSSLGYGWLVVNGHNELQIRDSRAIGYSDDISDPGTESLISSAAVNPHSTAFGLKIILSVQIFDDNDVPSEWDIHDVAVSYTYDDEDGSCSPETAREQATACDDSYLDTHGINVDAPTIATFDDDLLGEEWSIQNIEVGDPDSVRSDVGIVANPDLNEVDFQRSARVIELDFTPQTPLLDAGTVEVLVNFDIDSLQGFAPVIMYISSSDGSSPLWETMNMSMTIGPGKVTTYLDSNDLENVRIFLMLVTALGGDQHSPVMRNATVTVSHLNDVSVCGLQLTNSPSDNSGSGNVAGVGALPATGNPANYLVFTSAILISCGGLILLMTRRGRKSKLENTYLS